MLTFYLTHVRLLGYVSWLLHVHVLGSRWYLYLALDLWGNSCSLLKALSEFRATVPESVWMLVGGTGRNILCSLYLIAWLLVFLFDRSNGTLRGLMIGKFSNRSLVSVML